MGEKAHALGPTVRVILCAVTMLVILLWLALAGVTWRDHVGVWAPVQFLAALTGQGCLLMGFIAADDGHPDWARRLLVGAACAFLLWLVLMDASGLWHGAHPRPPEG
jgi:hypothetical protein